MGLAGGALAGGAAGKMAGVLQRRMEAPGTGGIPGGNRSMIDARGGAMPSMQRTDVMPQRGPAPAMAAAVQQRGPTGTHIEGMPQAPGGAPPASWPRAGVLTPDEVYAARGEMARRNARGIDETWKYGGEGVLFQADKAAGTPVVHLRGKGGMDVKTWKTPGPPGTGIPEWDRLKSGDFERRANMQSLAPVSRPPMSERDYLRVHDKANDAATWSHDYSYNRDHDPRMPPTAPSRPPRPATTEIQYGGADAVNPVGNQYILDTEMLRQLGQPGASRAKNWSEPYPSIPPPAPMQRTPVPPPGMANTSMMDDLPPLPPADPNIPKQAGWKYAGPDQAALSKQFDDEWWAQHAANPPPKGMRSAAEMERMDPLAPLPPPDPEFMQALLASRAKTVPPPRRGR
jgi:hypothetical protein